MNERTVIQDGEIIAATDSRIRKAFDVGPRWRGLQSPLRSKHASGRIGKPVGQKRKK